jgi:NAD-dependent DNA ligase
MEHNPDLERFIQLSWQILEHKYRYYILVNPVISDYEYDMLEKEYDALADKLGLPKSASDMVDFDTNRPSCQRVAEKLSPAGVNKRRKKR